MTVQTHLTINGTKAAVWAAISDIRNAADIISGVQKIEVLEEPAKGLVGLKWRETRLYFDKPAAVDKWITEAAEQKYYKTRAEMDGFVFITTMTIAGNDGSVELTSSHETQAQGFLARIKSLPMIFFKGMLIKAIKQDLMDIKKAVERT